MKKRIFSDVTERIHKKFKIKCLKLGRSMSDVVHELINEYLKKR